jgi:hypothetical protein
MVGVLYFLPNPEVLLCQMQKFYCAKYRKNIPIYFVFLDKYVIFISTYNYKYNLSPAKVFAPLPSWTFALKPDIYYYASLQQM